MSPSRAALPLATAGIALALVAAGALIAPSVRAAGDTIATCIKVRGEARYLGLGYNHIVHVANICAQDAECEVSTDVNPQPAQVTVSGHDEVEVNTFLGSPSRVFTPKVDCKFARR